MEFKFVFPAKSIRSDMFDAVRANNAALGPGRTVGCATSKPIGA